MKPKLPTKLLYGGDYNPEQWPESVWLEDVRMMRAAGVNMVSVGIFSWAKLQPAEKRWDFGWLDRVLDLLAKNGISACLATATASPPPWLTKQYPEVLPVTADGVTLAVGSRQQYSPSSRVYQKFAAALARKIAQRYRRHPALAAWHINNEYACHLHECHGADSTVAFRAWLRAKYRTLAALNAAWGTAFWSQAYGDWDEIFTPRRAPYHSNPTQCLDFKRFTSDAFLGLHRMEAAILRAATPNIPLTTNFMGFFKPLDYRAWASEIDFVAWDSYPDPVDEPAARHAGAVGHDLMRSLKPDRPFVLMEQASSAVNWRPVNLPKRPGLMRLQSLQALARGGDGVMFFQWRASLAGAEKFHSAGSTRSYSIALSDVQRVIDAKPGHRLIGVSLCLARGRTVLVADTAIHEMPSAAELAEIAIEAAGVARRLGYEPRVALLSFSTFGNPKAERAEKIQEAVKILDGMRVDFEYDGEMSADVALNRELMAQYPFSRLGGPANVLVMPAFHSASISTKMLQELGGAMVVGPLIVGLDKPVQLVSLGAKDADLVNMAALAAFNIGG